MITKRTVLAILSVLLWHGSSVCALDVVTFGDSLTHNDLLNWVYGNPRDMYGADPMEAVFDQAAGAADQLKSYAIAGSESEDLASQIDWYDQGRQNGTQPQADVIGYECGGNDIRGNMTLLAQYGVGEDAEADAVIDRILSNLADQLAYLASTHPNGRAVLWNLPDVTLTPEWYGALTEREIANVRAHIQRVNQFIDALADLSNVVVLDLYGILTEIVADPPVIAGRTLVPPPAYGDYDHAFADTIHPTAVGNAIIANAIIQAINDKWGSSIPLYSDQELAELMQ